MEELFQNSALFVFFFATISIFNYSNLKIEQRLSIIFASVYALVAIHMISLKMACIYLFLTMICYLEIFTTDHMKLKLLINPFYKFIDCVYLSIAQYYIVYILLSIFCFYYKFEVWFGNYAIFLKLFSVIPLGIGITKTLRQKFVVNSFKNMYHIFSEYPINKVTFNKKLDEANDILVSIEDREYFSRKAYTFLSVTYLRSIFCKKSNRLSFRKLFKKSGEFVANVFNFRRGYSTIPMQLIRTIGIRHGYICTLRRKIFEILYPRMFFNGLQRLYKEEIVAKRKNFKEYLLYIYFHVAKTYLGDATFSKFLNAFDMRYREKNKIDIYDCSNEGIFIACMGLNRRATKINSDNIDYYLKPIHTSLNKDIILDMTSKMMDKPYNGNYLE